MREFEYKCLVDSNTYKNILDKIIAIGTDIKRVLLINYFYDTKNNELNSMDITFRVRQIDDKLFLQLKIPVKREGLMHVRDEFSKQIDTLPLCVDLRETHWANSLDLHGIVYLKGVLVTERTTCRIEEGIKIDIDKNSYLGVTDYEIEIEFEPQMQIKTEEMLKDLVGNFSGTQHTGKRPRFFNKLKDMQKDSKICNHELIT